ncbi:alpha/beta fold hydrolase [Oceaniglobus ichthyenteri]|uniref:alpha/beta fold hydrolase n=1 Tax=Oceaniglobus ichthyenteri TaxID=2136177 RepID=UPI000D39335E|nr:alpha/beta hydrolase [Oceaniglobus ichthyenteri]
MSGPVEDIHHRLTGTGRRLLLVSGLNGRAQFWDPVVTALSSRFSVLTFDQRGCGATPDDGVAWNIESLASDAFAVATRAFGGAPFTVIGHSTGGAIAQWMAASQPERIEAAVLSGTWLRASGYMRALFELRRDLLLRAPDLDPALGHLLRVPLGCYTPLEPGVAPDPGVAHRRINALLDHDGTPLSPRITCPTLVVAARDDRIIPPHMVQDLHANLPHGELRLLVDGGHFFPQTRTKVFESTLTDWLGNR